MDDPYWRANELDAELFMEKDYLYRRTFTLTVDRRKDEWGESFAICVNSVSIFAMGADYIPEDNILRRITPERTRRLLEDAAAAHHNAIRVWGGEYDPDTFYWPASPSSGGGFDDPNDENRGDVHDWTVWHGGVPFTEYRKHRFRFVSEFGFQSLPCMKTIERFTLPQDRNLFSYVMEKHQRNNAANGKILNYLSQTFLYPADFDTLLYASQLLQAEAIRRPRSLSRAKRW